jgi:hypothetical protein
MKFKVFARIMFLRLQPLIEPQLAETQHGFRPGRSVRDPIATLLLLIERLETHKRPLHLATIDRVNRQALRNILMTFYRIHPSHLWTC